MLREYEYTENWRLLDQALTMFIELPSRLSLVGYEALSPDSFLWKIYDGKQLYFLYAEDYVPSLEHVKKEIRAFWPDQIKLEFLPVKDSAALEDSGPYQSAVVYKAPEKEYEFMKYAGQSGYDFVFLLKSDEKIEN